MVTIWLESFTYLGLYLPNCQTNLVIALHALSLLFWNFINSTAYHLSRYEVSSTKELHTLGKKQNFTPNVAYAGGSLPRSKKQFKRPFSNLELLLRLPVYTEVWLHFISSPQTCQIDIWLLIRSIGRYYKPESSCQSGSWLGSLHHHLPKDLAAFQQPWSIQGMQWIQSGWIQGHGQQVCGDRKACCCWCSRQCLQTSWILNLLLVQGTDDQTDLQASMCRQPWWWPESRLK